LAELRSLGLKGRFASKEFPKSVALYKLFLYLCSREKVKQGIDSMDTNTNLKKWLWLVVIGALVAAVVLLAVALNYAVRAERNARYVGLMNVVAEKLSKTVRGVEMNAENVFDEVAKHLESPQAVIEALAARPA
jgi:hypothetical protein